MPPQTGARPQVFAVGRGRTVHRHHVEDGICRIHAWPQRNHVLLSKARSNRDGDLATDGELIKQLIQSQHAVACGLLKGHLQFRDAKAVGIPSKHTAIGTLEVSCPQIGSQQITSCEAGIKVQPQVVVERGGVRQGHRALWSSGEGVVGTIHRVSAGVDRRAHEVAATDHEGGQTGQLGGGGELRGFQFTHRGLQCIRAALEEGQLFVKFPQQPLQFVAAIGDAIETGIEQGCRFKAGQGAPAVIQAIGVARHTAITFDQVGEGLIGPVGGPQIGELVDGDNLIGTTTVHRAAVGVGGHRSAVGSKRLGDRWISAEATRHHQRQPRAVLERPQEPARTPNSHPRTPCAATLMQLASRSGLLASFV